MNRSIEPDIKIPEKVNVIHPQIFIASNGVKLYELNATELDVIRLSLVFRAGTRYQSTPFTASTVANMLSEGSAKYSSADISEKIDYYGAYFDVNIDRDYTIISMCTLSRFLPDILDLMREITIHPQFDDREIEIYRAKRKQQLKVEREKVSFRARELFSIALFGKDHPYGVSYPLDDYDSLKRELLTAFYSKFYSAENCFAVIAGRVSQSERDLITQFVEEIPTGGVFAENTLPKLITTTKIYEYREEALQSAIRIGKVMFPRNHPDYIGMQLLVTVLGGYFGSRLVSNLREDKGFTYGIFSTMVNLDNEGYLAIATEVGAEFTDAAIDEIYGEIERLRTDVISDEELAVVKNIITGEFMRILDGPFGIADVTIENIECATDNNYVNRFLDEVRSTTPAQLLELANKYLTSDGFVEVVVGNRN